MGPHWVCAGCRGMDGPRAADRGSVRDVLFTDGLFESRTGTTERLGEERLLEYARTRVDASADDFVDALIGHAESLAADSAA